MARYNVRNEVLIPLSLTFAVLIFAFVWACYGIRRTDERLLLNQHFWSAQSVLEGLLKENAALLASTAEFLASKPHLQQAIIRNDVKQLTEHSRPLLDRLSKQLDITHFYYYDPLGKLVLRVYFPKDVSQPGTRRKNLQQAMASGRPVTGLEIGRHGSFAQRLVFPWYVDGQLVGYIELGTDLIKILDKVKTISQVEMIVAIDKDHVSHLSWEDFSSKRKTTFPWNFLADKLISDTTIELPQKTAAKVFNSSEYGSLDNELHIGERRFRGLMLPRSDSQEHHVGDLLMLVDITDHKSVFYNFLTWVIGFSLLLSGTLFIFAYRVLGRVGSQLAISEDRLLQESARLSEVNDKLLQEIDVRTQTESELKQLNQTLEERVRERTAELEQKNSLLEQNRLALESTYRELKEKQAAILHQDKMACIGQLAAGVAHDINNPVGFISHNLTLFERYFQRLTQFITLQQELIKSIAVPEMEVGWQKAWRDFRVAEVFEEIPVMLGECQDGTTRITQIVQGLRTFIRSETPDKELTDLHECIDSTLMLLRHELRDKIRVVKEYQPIPRRCFHTQQMNQLFMNLLLNACQAIEENGEIRIRTWSEDRQILIAISDTGCGISAEIRDKIYDPFFTTKPIGMGTGLGLSIVYEAVMNHHGALAVESAVAQGTTFTISFPVDCAEEPTLPPCCVTAENASGDLHV